MDNERTRAPRAPRQRIVVLDGAMGTHDPGAEARRGRLPRASGFRDWPQDVKGNNDLLTLTQPEAVLDIHRSLPRGRRGHHRDEHLHVERAVAGGLRHGGARLRD